MIAFPNAKINLGLGIGATLPNGYHEIVTAMVPVTWTDVLECVESPAGETRLHASGRPVDCPPEKNLVIRAWEAFRAEVPQIAPQDIYLRKIIPDGAGLGGGSADAAFTLRLLNDIAGKPLTDSRLEELAATLGSDCPMFIANRPVVATGTGTVLSPLDIDLSQLTNILIVKSSRSVSTREAYAEVEPSYLTEEELRATLALPVGEWQGRLANDFERSVRKRLPEIGVIKHSLLAEGALYAAMSGSGSAVFGIFPTDKMADPEPYLAEGWEAHRCAAVGL